MSQQADVAQGDDDAGRPEPDLVRPFSKTIGEDPAILFAQLRRTCPVALQQGVSGASGRNVSAWLVTRYEDIVAAAGDTDTFGQFVRWSDRRRPPLEADPPEHGPMRALLQPFFMPRALAAFEPISRGLAESLLQPILEGGGGDLARGLCRPLPPQVLLARLGQPLADWEAIKAACEAVYLQGSPDPQDIELYESANEQLWAYSHAVVADRRRSPRPPNADLVSALLAGTAGVAALSDDLAAGVVRLLVAAGHDSTTSAMGVCLRRIVENLDLQARLRSDPSLIPAAVEEMLRLEAPVLQMPRRVRRDTQLGGRRLREGDRVLLVFASGNRDDTAFEAPDTCRIERSPNRHLSFGVGVHTCIGNGLARQEIRVALQTLLARTTTVVPAGSSEREFWHPYGAASLEVRCTPA
jgi:cytochrome P450